MTPFDKFYEAYKPSDDNEYTATYDDLAILAWNAAINASISRSDDEEYCNELQELIE